MHNVPNLFSGASVSAGNTAGALAAISSGTLYLAGGNNVTLSQNANSLTFSGINAGAQNMGFWQNLGVNGSITDAMAQTGTVHGSLRLFQLDIGNNIFAGNMTVSTILLDVTANISASIADHKYSVLFGLYTNNGSHLSLLNSGSVSFGTFAAGSATSSYNGTSYYHGKRWISMHYSNFSNTDSSGVTMSQGLYYAGLIFLTSAYTGSFSSNTSKQTMAMSHYGAFLGESGQRSGTIGSASVTVNYIGQLPFQGIYSATTSAFPASIHSSAIVKSAQDACFIPHLVFNNILGSF